MTTIRRTCALVAGLAGGALIMPSAEAQAQSFPYAAKDYGLNLLENGGFEDWSLGTSPTTPPVRWFVMGDAGNTFLNTGFIDVERVPAESECTRGQAGGEWAVELRSNVPGSYLSQRLLGFGESRCKTVSVSARLKTSFGGVTPTITIDDGVSTSSDTRTLVTGEWQTLSVTHKVSGSATRLEVRLDPGSNVTVDDVQLVLGDQPRAPFAPRGNVERGLHEVALGTVEDWYRMNSSIPVPEGYAICDGSVVIDPESHFFGLTLPNMDERVVRGETNPNQTGATGGSDSHTHSIPSNAPTWLVLQTPIGPTLMCLRGGTTQTTTSASNWPPYIKLLKIMRIR